MEFNILFSMLQDNTFQPRLDQSFVSTCFKTLQTLFFCRKDNLNSHIQRVHPDLLRTSVGQNSTGSGLTESEIVGESEEDSVTETPTREIEEIEAKFFCGASSEGLLPIQFGNLSYDTLELKLLALLMNIIQILDNKKVPRHPSFLLKIKITILVISFSLSLPLSQAPSLCSPPFLFLSLSLPL